MLVDFDLLWKETRFGQFASLAIAQDVERVLQVEEVGAGQRRESIWRLSVRAVQGRVVGDSLHQGVGAADEVADRRTGKELGTGN